MLSALSFLSVLVRSPPPTERTLRWFPLAGAVVGGVVAAAWWGAQHLWAPAVAAALAVAVDLGVTGLLHMDGLADSVDGLVPHLDRERRLEVMRQPDVGSFALAVVPAVVLLRWTSLAAGAISPWSVVALWSASRTLVAAVPCFVSYARPGGLASSFLGAPTAWVLIALVPAAAVLIVAEGVIGLVALMVATVGAMATIEAARRRLGGFTGDVLGAAIVVSETAALLALATR